MATAISCSANAFCERTGAQSPAGSRDRDALRRARAGHARRCALHRRPRLSAAARHGARSRLAAALPAPLGGDSAARSPARRAPAARCTRRSIAYTIADVNHETVAAALRAAGAADTCCMATPIGPAFTPSGRRAGLHAHRARRLVQPGQRAHAGTRAEPELRSPAAGAAPNEIETAHRDSRDRAAASSSANSSMRGAGSMPARSARARRARSRYSLKCRDFGGVQTREQLARGPADRRRERLEPLAGARLDEGAADHQIDLAPRLGFGHQAPQPLAHSAPARAAAARSRGCSMSFATCS